jgi:hypothetical protein
VGQGLAKLSAQRADPTEQDYRDAVETTIRFFDAGGSHYEAVAQTRAISTPERPPPTPEADLREVARVMSGWATTYDGARTIVTDKLQGDAALARRLGQSYSTALTKLHALSKRAPRVNVIIVAAPGKDDDQFIKNAAAYAKTYFGKGAGGAVVEVREGIASLDAMLGAVEAAQPERLVGRVDIFAHGTIEPSNQLKLAGRWHTADQIEAAMNARALTSAYLQSTSRFDATSVIEFHGCRLGGGEGDRFLGTAGKAFGGEHGQETVGYDQRFFPRRYQVNWRGTQVVETEKDVYATNSLPVRITGGKPKVREANRKRFIKDFEAEAIRLFDALVAGSQEGRSFMTPAEAAAPQQLSRDRKVAVMRAMYDANGAWLLGFLHPAHSVPDVDPVSAVGSDKYTFTRERDAWESHTLRVRAGTGP